MSHAGDRPPNPRRRTEPRLRFAIVGDSRGDSEGVQPAVFHDLVAAIVRENPDLVLNVGDMINGYPGESASHLGMMWNGYRSAISRLSMPVRHAPGNHDVFDDVSRSVWTDRFGPTSYQFDAGGVRFIALDTETEPGRIGRRQFEWLVRSFESAEGRPIVVFLHRPLFPVDGHVGISLDAFPEERDALHRLFAQHRRSLRGVFQGHEHLYHCERRDGVPYYVTGGGGEELYLPAELGGFHHYLLVEIAGSKTRVEVRRAGACPSNTTPARRIEPGARLDGWKSGVFWSTWDHSVATELSLEHRGEVGLPLRLTFDHARYEWPMLTATLAPPRPVRKIELELEIAEQAGPLALFTTVERDETQEAPPIPLKPGRNSVALSLATPARRDLVREVQFALGVVRSGSENNASSDSHGGALFHDIRFVVDGARDVLRTRFDRPGPWGIWGLQSPGSSDVRFVYDFARCAQPRLFCGCHPPLDLGAVRAVRLQLSVDCIDSAPSVRLALRRDAERCATPPTRLTPGRNEFRIPLAGGWLPNDLRRRAEVLEIEFAPESGAAPRGIVILHDLEVE